MARASEDDVRAIIGSDSTLKVSFFIETAEQLVDYVDSCDTDGTLNTTQLRHIETWLAAHFYAIRDQQYASKKTGDASAVFQGKTDMALDSTQWGQQAMILDVTGKLATINQNAKRGKITAGMTWLGKPKSSQTEYQDRD
jgi:competence protein ComGF